VQAARDAFDRAGMVILHELIRQAEGLKLVPPKRFHEEAAAILENFRHHDNYVFRESGFDFDFHWCSEKLLGM